MQLRNYYVKDAHHHFTLHQPLAPPPSAPAQHVLTAQQDKDQIKALGTRFGLTPVQFQEWK
jgi:hypothetical protein